MTSIQDDTKVQDVPISKELGEKPDESTTDVADELDPKESSPDAAGDYPHGFQLFCVVAALLLNVFLVALDQVSNSLPSPIIHPLIEVRLSSPRQYQRSRY
jgi:hypothetical protein